MRSIHVATGVVLALFVAACSSGAGSESVADEQNLSSLARCPTTDAAEKQALANIATVAETCGDVPEPSAGPSTGFRVPRQLSAAHHRGRDAIFPAGDAQWVLGKFTYGAEFDLMGESVDIWLLRGCAGEWEKIGTADTTGTNTHHATIEGVEDNGGRVFFEIPEAKRLGIGRHRIRMIVSGDGTTAEQYIEILPRGAAIAVSDVDGTLTEKRFLNGPLVCDEESDFPALASLITDQPKVHKGAARALTSLAKAGYRPFYLTARPEGLQPHTHGFLRERNRDDERGELPEGIVHTTLGVTGAINSAAEEFKKAELAALAAKGFVITFGFGNRKSDVAAYNGRSVPFRFYYENPSTLLRHCSQISDLTELPSPFPRVKSGDFKMGSYEDLESAFDAVPAICR